MIYAAGWAPTCRDIKAENIMWCLEEKAIRLLDFGACYKGAMQQEDVLVMETVVGTPGCAAPEVWAGSEEA